MDDQTLRFFGIVPGALIKMKLWNEWNTLIEAVAKNDSENVRLNYNILKYSLHCRFYHWED